MAENRSTFSGTSYETFTPSDSVSFGGNPIRGIILGEDGPLGVMDLNGDITVIPNLVGGIVHPLQAIQVRATGTSATSVTLVR